MPTFSSAFLLNVCHAVSLARPRRRPKRTIVAVSPHFDGFLPRDRKLNLTLIPRAIQLQWAERSNFELHINTVGGRLVCGHHNTSGNSRSNRLQRTMSFWKGDFGDASIDET